MQGLMMNAPLEISALIRHADRFHGDTEMRNSAHQLKQGLFIAVWQTTDAKNKYSVEHTGYTLAPVKAYAPYVSSTPTSCQMKRP